MPRTIKVSLEIPDGISDPVRATAQSRAEEAVVLALWEAGSISTRVAAENLGLEYYDFLDLVTSRGLSIERRPVDLTAIEQAVEKLTPQSMP